MPRRPGFNEAAANRCGKQPVMTAETEETMDQVDEGKLPSLWILTHGQAGTSVSLIETVLLEGY